MDTVLKTKKGYNMLEMIICIFILASITLLALNYNSEISFKEYYYLNNYLFLQSKSFCEKKEYDAGNNVYFNHMGHVNQAKTIRYDIHNIIIHLGNGYATFE